MSKRGAWWFVFEDKARRERLASRLMRRFLGAQNASANAQIAAQQGAMQQQHTSHAMAYLRQILGG